MDNKQIKYITYYTRDGFKTGFMFPSETDHNIMQRRLGVHRTSVIDTGFCKFVSSKLFGDESVLQIKCYGKSISMDVISTVEDSLILTNEYLGISYEVTIE